MDRSRGEMGRPQSHCSRRDLLQGAAALACVSLTGCVGPHIYRTRVLSGSVLVPAAELERLREVRDTLLVRTDQSGPILVRRLASGRLVALIGVCTHRGCELVAEPRGYDCPCHGSRFDVYGKVLAGPATRPLTLLVVQKQGADLRIDL